MLYVAALLITPDSSGQVTSWPAPAWIGRLFTTCSLASNRPFGVSTVPAAAEPSL